MIQLCIGLLQRYIDPSDVHNLSQSEAGVQKVGYLSMHTVMSYIAVRQVVHHNNIIILLTLATYHFKI